MNSCQDPVSKHAFGDGDDRWVQLLDQCEYLIREATLRTLARHDLILLPTCPITAFERGALAADPIAMYLQDIFTVQANLAGTPAISVPLGTDADGMPFGAQLLAAPFGEEVLLRAAAHLPTR